MKVAVLGSAFDPPTLGHYDVVLQCLAEFDEVWLVPAFRHAFGKAMTAYDHRVAMAELFCQDIDNQKVKLFACEDRISKDASQPVYSIDLLTYLAKQQPTAELSLVIGPDNHKVIDSFYHSEQLISQFSPFIAEERKAIRSTAVREAVANGHPLEALVSPKVAHYIFDHKLYQG